VQAVIRFFQRAAEIRPRATQNFVANIKAHNLRTFSKDYQASLEMEELTRLDCMSLVGMPHALWLIRFDFTVEVGSMKALKYFVPSVVLTLGLMTIPALAQSQPQDSQPQAQQPQQQPQSQAGQMPDSASQTQSFTGKIVKTSEGLVLQDQSTNTSYKLDNEKAAKKFSNKQVKVTGTLDSATNTIHVSDIELAGKSY
jgi:uncharacterized protein YdeI (BOF family)